jgi:hypothetical protein
MSIPAAAPPLPASLVVRASTAKAAFDRAAAAVEVHHAGDADPWSGSAYAWMKHLSSTRRFKAAESILESLFVGAGFVVSPRTAPGHAWLVEGSRVAMKFSTLWNSGVYTFQQVLPGNFDVMVLFGVSPDTPHLWIAEKPAVLSAVGSSSTPWLSVDPTSPPPVLDGRGGSVVEFYDAAALVLGAPSGLQYGPAQLG